jgi:hypothetical protein
MDALVRLNQRFAIDACFALPVWPCGYSVTKLESRTLHQPGKLQNMSKNEDVFTPFNF